MKNIRTVIWDCDGVTWFHRPNESQILTEALQISAVKEFEGEFLYMIEQFNKHFSTGIVTEKEMLKIVKNTMPILFFYNITPEKFMQTWHENKFVINVLNEDAIKVMEYIQNSGMQNIVKSDWWRDVQENLLKEYGLLQYIERLYCCDNSYLKCNPLSAKDIIKPGKEEEFIIIGDSLRSDIAFANHAGIESVWFNPKGKVNDTQYQPTYEVKSLLEIIELFEKNNL